MNPSDHTTKMGRLAAAAVFATALEWFDFLIYATAAALVLGPLFFPAASPVAGTLASFATFAVGFVARPLGGIIAGHVGDRFGRKPPLVAAMLLMGVATFAIGVLPDYATIGVWAPILLVVARLIQGLGVGAQWGGAALLLTEHAPVARRGFYGSLVQTGAVLGAVAGNLFFVLLTTALTEEQFTSWGWRIPFLSGLLLVLIGCYVQLKIEDTPVFRELQQQTATAKHEAGLRKAPLVDAVRSHWRQILQAAGAFFVVNATFYFLISGMLNYATTHIGMSQATILWCVMIAGLTQVVTMPFFGALTDRMGTRKKLYLTGTVLMAAFAFPMFWLVDTGSVPLVFLALLVAFTIHATMYGPQATLYAEMFPADVRYSGASLGYQFASVFAGGLAPFITTALLAATGSSWSVALYIIATAAVTFVAVASIRERFQRDLYTTSAAEAATTSQR
ncbi:MULTISPECIES: MFS transporter [Prauserella salsuginis group]|uniref:MFS transporter n=2 Tax=Prauserella salsuginis group TaxID=2893672 RepID=A0ABW6GBP8_9PSEU|nr:MULTISPECIES: MFS transporter [Prauserella salsuginis group]MBB3665690.1 metabolite-proton symporter [Prauserella sediminis]MCR3722882.1 metabolite-proton symporter [Prauserella flava]MCR3737443.1 metabolite-proton symporter [Prauserella salsuginis]